MKKSMIKILTLAACVFVYGAQVGIATCETYEERMLAISGELDDNEAAQLSAASSDFDSDCFKKNVRIITFDSVLNYLEKSERLDNERVQFYRDLSKDRDRVTRMFEKNFTSDIIGVFEGPVEDINGKAKDSGTSEDKDKCVKYLNETIKKYINIESIRQQIVLLFAVSEAFQVSRDIFWFSRTNDPCEYVVKKGCQYIIVLKLPNNGDLILPDKPVTFPEYCDPLHCATTNTFGTFVGATPPVFHEIGHWWLDVLSSDTSNANEVCYANKYDTFKIFPILREIFPVLQTTLFTKCDIDNIISNEFSNSLSSFYKYCVAILDNLKEWADRPISKKDLLKVINNKDSDKRNSELSILFNKFAFNYMYGVGWEVMQVFGIDMVNGKLIVNRMSDIDHSVDLGRPIRALYCGRAITNQTFWNKSKYKDNNCSGYKKFKQSINLQIIKHFEKLILSSGEGRELLFLLHAKDIKKYENKIKSQIQMAEEYRQKRVAWKQYFHKIQADDGIASTINKKRRRGDKIIPKNFDQRREMFFNIAQMHLNNEYNFYVNHSIVNFVTHEINKETFPDLIERHKSILNDVLNDDTPFSMKTFTKQLKKSFIEFLQQH